MKTLKLYEYLEQVPKLIVTSQPDQKSLHKVGVYPVDVDSGDTPDSGCHLGCSQLQGLAICPLFKKMKVKEQWDVVMQSKRCKRCLKTGHRHQQCTKKKPAI